MLAHRLLVLTQQCCKGENSWDSGGPSCRENLHIHEYCTSAKGAKCAKLQLLPPPERTQQFIAPAFLLAFLLFFPVEDA